MIASHLLRRYPAGLFFISYLTGIVLTRYIACSEQTAMIALILAMGYAFYCVIKKLVFKSGLKSAEIILLLIFTLCLPVATKTKKALPPLSSDGVRLSVCGIVNDIPKYDEAKTQFAIKVLYSNDSVCISNEYMLVSCNDVLSGLMPGDHVHIINGYARPVTNRGNPGEFDLKSYYNSKGIYRKVFAAGNNISIEPSIAPGINDIQIISRRLQCKLLQRLQKSSLNTAHIGLAESLILGYKKNLDEDIRDDFSETGMLHVLAVSGLHTGAIYFVFGLMFFFLNKNKYLKILKGFLLMLILFSYAFVTGLSPSVVRSCTMFSFFIIGNMIHRKCDSIHILMISAVMILIFDPESLFLPGFQLSYSAVWGILFFHPKLKMIVTLRHKFSERIIDLFFVGLGAQIGTLPFTLFYFSQYPVYSLFTNLLVIPLIMMIFYLFLLILILPGFSFLCQITSYITTFILGITKTVARFPIANLTVYNFDIINMVLVSLLIIFLSVFIYSPRSKYLIVGLTISISIMTHLITIQFANRVKNELWFFNDYTQTPVLYIKSGNATLMNYENEKFRLWHKNFLTKNNLRNLINISDSADDSGLKNNKHLKMYNTDGQTIAILDFDISDFEIETTQNIDFLILESRCYHPIEKIVTELKPTRILISPSVSEQAEDKILKMLSDFDVPVYSLRNNGAYCHIFSD